MNKYINFIDLICIVLLSIFSIFLINYGLKKDIIALNTVFICVYMEIILGISYPVTAKFFIWIWNYKTFFVSVNN